MQKHKVSLHHVIIGTISSTQHHGNEAHSRVAVLSGVLSTSLYIHSTSTMLVMQLQLLNYLKVNFKKGVRHMQLIVTKDMETAGLEVEVLES